MTAIPMTSYKSTCSTISLSVQLLLRDTNGPSGPSDVTGQQNTDCCFQLTARIGSHIKKMERTRLVFQHASVRYDIRLITVAVF